MIRPSDLAQLDDSSVSQSMKIPATTGGVRSAKRRQCLVNGKIGNVETSVGDSILIAMRLLGQR